MEKTKDIKRELIFCVGQKLKWPQGTAALKAQYYKFIVCMLKQTWAKETHWTCIGRAVWSVTKQLNAGVTCSTFTDSANLTLEICHIMIMVNYFSYNLSDVLCS